MVWWFARDCSVCVCVCVCCDVEDKMMGDDDDLEQLPMLNISTVAAYKKKLDLSLSLFFPHATLANTTHVEPALLIAYVISAPTTMSRFVAPQALYFPL